MPRPLGRSDWPLLIVAAVAGTLFFATVARLWPLMPGELRPDATALRAKTAQLDPLVGTTLELYRVSSRLRIDDRPERSPLKWVEATYGRELAAAAIRDGLPLAWNLVTFKKPGEPDSVGVAFLTDGRLMGWDRSVQEDMPGRELVGAEAEARAREVDALLGVDLTAYHVVERSTRRFPNRVDNRFAFECEWRPRAGAWTRVARDDDEEDDKSPALRERLEVLVAGDRIAKAWRSVVLPGKGERSQREDRAAVEGTAAVGFALLAAGGIAALAVALRRLIIGDARLGPPAKLTVIAGLLLIANNALQQPALFEQWDPLWPRWVSELRELAYDLIDDLAQLLMLFFFVVAGDALDRRRAATGVERARAASLWALGRGELADPAIVAASVRGFLVGAICGGVLALGVLLALLLPGARVAVQPRGFFFFPLNSAAPALTTVCFFAYIALLEELGYRFFGGTWLESLTMRPNRDRRSHSRFGRIVDFLAGAVPPVPPAGRKWLAIVIPAAVYGLCHTSFDFLPPAAPFWARPLLLALVGCVWGWAFFRFDALTVVLSHLTCDLFIFNWPALAGGGSGAALAAIALSVPLWPAAIALVSLRLKRAVG